MGGDWIGLDLWVGWDIEHQYGAENDRRNSGGTLRQKETKDAPKYVPKMSPQRPQDAIEKIIERTIESNKPYIEA